MICKNCKKEFESKRKTAKYCSNKCRIAFNRLSVTEPPKVSVTSEEEVSVTKTLECEFCKKISENKFCSERCRKLDFLSKPENAEVSDEITLYDEDRKEIHKMRIKARIMTDLVTGVTGDGALRDKKSIPGLQRGKNPWGDLLRTPEDQQRLVKVLENYY